MIQEPVAKSTQADDAEQTSYWELVGELSPLSLMDTWRQLHYASQILASAGATFGAPAEDFSHHALTWDDEECVLRTELAMPPKPFYVCLGLADLTLILYDGPGRRVEEYELGGRTIAHGMEWLDWSVRARLGRDLEKSPELPTHDLPNHEIADGAPFSEHNWIKFEEVARWIANADRFLKSFARSQPGASTVRLWPHHFDIATLVTFSDASTKDSGGDAESTPSVGVGLSPADGSIPAPYFYVTPWPYPKVEELPDLDGAGYWHTNGWIGAILRSDEIVAQNTAAAQRNLVERFVRSAFDACAGLVVPS